MAFAVGSYVALARTGTLLNGFFGKKPLFGRIYHDAGDGAWDVLWEDGRRQAGIPAAALDQILATAISPALVRVLNAAKDEVSGYYDCLVAAKYTRKAGGSTETDSYVLLKAVNEDQYVEVTATDYATLEGR